MLLTRSRTTRRRRRSCWRSVGLGSSRRRLGEVKTRYVLVVDASVEFTHNSNLARLRSLLQSGQVHVATPMTEDASTSELFSQCFDVGSLVSPPVVRLPRAHAADSARLRGRPLREQRAVRARRPLLHGGHGDAAADVAGAAVPAVAGARGVLRGAAVVRHARGVLSGQPAPEQRDPRVQPLARGGRGGVRRVRPASGRAGRAEQEVGLRRV